jgi:hypothetical protein
VLVDFSVEEANVTRDLAAAEERVTTVSERAEAPRTAHQAA